MTFDYAICCGFDQGFILNDMRMCDAHLLSIINNVNTKAKIFLKNKPHANSVGYNPKTRLVVLLIIFAKVTGRVTLNFREKKCLCLHNVHV